MTRTWSNGAKAAVLAPLAALSVAWTVAVVTVETPSPAASTPGADRLPDGTTVPSEAIKAPASVSRSQAKSAGAAAQAIAIASTNAIPSAALAAYQRAETVINTADETCHLPWQLVAAIGRVESDHGRFGGSSLDDEGLARPGIVGPRLDGRRGVQEISDTDAGLLDGDERFDRAVGPMQFIPSTWSVVGVDADNDGQRDPQDIDDAALATAVYLCAGQDDLSTEAGQRASMLRYNPSETYVDLVLVIMNAYLTGDYTAVPNGTVAGGFLTPMVPSGGDGPGGGGGGGGGDGKPGDPGEQDGGPDGPGSPTPGTPAPTPTGTPAPTPTGGPTGGPKPTPTSPANPTSPATPQPSPTLPLPPLPTPTLPLPTPSIITEAEAIAQCLAQGLIDNPARPRRRLRPMRRRPAQPLVELAQMVA